MPATAPRQRAIAHGRRSFGSSWRPASIVEAPGRLELLGNHVDYNGGLVLAGAIDRVVAVVAGHDAGGDSIQFTASDLSEKVVSIGIGACRDWRHRDGAVGPNHYVRGVLASLLAREHPVNSGLQLSVAGDVPLGFGMSSSAALCVALAMTLSTTELEPPALVAVARDAEHRCGSPVGAMDQSVAVAGGVILFDGRDASFSSIAPDLGNFVFAVADSGVTHALGQSSYSTRVAESQEALNTIRSLALPDLQSLGELAQDVWASVRSALANRLIPVHVSRVEHVVTEVERVRIGLKAVNASNWDRFGQLMTESGRSSNELYEISHPDVEALVAELLAIEGVAGARMMGGGEGGPALALIDREALTEARDILSRGFFQSHPSHLDGERLQACSFGPGARKETLE